MTTRPSLSAPLGLLLALLAGCDWGSKPSLPGDPTEDASFADVGVPTGNDATAQGDSAFDVPPTPDVPPPPDGPAVPADAVASDSAPPPFDAAPGMDGGAMEDCRFMASRDGVTPPAGAVVVDGGYYVNDRNEACAPTPRGDGGADASDAGDASDARDDSGDAGASDGADVASEGGRP